MNEEVKKLLTGIAVQAEMAKAYYDAFKTAGFNEDEAMYMAAEMSVALLQISLENAKDRD